MPQEPHPAWDGFGTNLRQLMKISSHPPQARRALNGTLPNSPQPLPLRKKRLGGNWPPRNGKSEDDSESRQRGPSRGESINLLFQEMADDGHGTFNWRITAFRHVVTENSELGVEATEALHEFGRAFGAEMNAAAAKIDMTLPEALSFRKAWEDLRDEFQSFMSLVPLSNAVHKVDLAGQAQQFATKLAALPPVRRRKQRPMSEHQPPDQSVAGITA